MLKKIFSALLMAAVLVPNIALASLDSSVPEFNPLCWKQKDCEEMRRQLNPENRETTGGWISPEPPCSGDWGKCLPSGITKTEISFGGRSEFLHLGDFIQYMYRYAVSIAAIVAVIVLMTAGYEWITSGGNSERISSAKKRIGGALMGLFLAFMSYFILNVINPNLVQFRLPQVWMIRPQRLVPPFCGVAPSTTVFAAGADSIDQTSPPTSTNADYDLHGLTYSGQPAPQGESKLNTDWKKDTFFCGKRFFMKDGGKDMCFGDVCLPDKDGNPQLCSDIPYNGKPSTELYYCRPGLVAGVIAGNGGGFGNRVLDQQWVGGNVELLALCNSGKIEEAAWATSDSSQAMDTYSITTRQLVGNDISAHCTGEAGGIAGFYFGVFATDQTGCFGRLMEGSMGSCGKSDWFAVGQASPGSHDCSTNITRLTRDVLPDIPAVPKTPGKCGYGNLECTCGFLSQSQTARTAAVTPEIRSHLLSLEELKRGYRCDITINRGEFPAADNAMRPPSITGVAKSAAALSAAGIACYGAAAVTGVLTAGIAGVTIGGICVTLGTTGAVYAGATFAVGDGVVKNWNYFTDPTACNKNQNTTPPAPDPFIRAKIGNP